MKLAIRVFFVVLLIPGCTERSVSSGPNDSLVTSGVQGHVSHPGGIPFDQMRVYPFSVVVLDDSGQVVATVQTDNDGNYTVALKPGTYTFCPGSCTDQFMKRGAKTATIVNKRYETVDLYLDNGMK